MSPEDFLKPLILPKGLNCVFSDELVDLKVIVEWIYLAKGCCKVEDVFGGEKANLFEPGVHVTVFGRNELVSFKPSFLQDTVE